MPQRDDQDSKKKQALKGHGLLHPHPEKVTDELFQQDGFFDSCDALQVKYEMLRRVRVDGWAANLAARKAGFSRPTFYEAQRAFTSRGLPGLMPARKGPRRAHKLSDGVMVFIESKIEEQPDVSLEELAGKVSTRFGLQVHPRSIGRALGRREKKTP